MSYYTSSYGGGAYPGRAYTAGASYASQPAAYSAQPAAYSAQPAYQTRGYTAQTPSYSTYQPSTASQVPSASSRYSSYTSASTAATPQVYRYPMGADPRTTTTPYASQYTAGQSTRASATPAATASATSAAPGVQRTRLATEVPKASNNPQTTYVPRPTTTTSKPAAKAPSAQAKVEEVEEISTPAAKAADDVEVLDADRDKVFDALFEAQVQAEESLMRQVQGQLMITGPPSEQQAEHMQKQAEQRFLRLPLEKVWKEFAKKHQGAAITKEEHIELCRCFITGNKRWSTGKNEQDKQQMAAEMASMGIPMPLVQMMASMTDNLMGGVEDTLYKKMSDNYEVIASAVWAKLNKDSKGCVTKASFLDKFLESFSEIVDKGMEQFVKSGELDAALGPLAGAGGGPIVMVAAVPMDEMMMGGLMGMGGGPLMIEGFAPEPAPQSRYSGQPSFAQGPTPYAAGPHPSASAYASSRPAYNTGPSYSGARQGHSYAAPSYGGASYGGASYGGASYGGASYGGSYYR